MTAASVHSSYIDWLTAFQRAHEDIGSLDDLACPSCGVKQLRLCFVTKEDREASGYVAFWCDSCRWGIAPGLSSIPPNGRRVRRGDRIIPDYHLIVPSGGAQGRSTQE